LAKNRDRSADDDLSAIKNKARQTPLLTQPSESMAHNYSFDIAMPISQKNVSDKN
jgi:hypothetical protein